MNRFIDYFVVLGVDITKIKSQSCSGKVIQRFPELDWPDVPLFEGLELFCQPQGWKLSLNQEKPSFFVSVFTDTSANKHYCACLSFHEPISIESFKVTKRRQEKKDKNELRNSSLDSKPSSVYAPKCLVLLSRHHYVELFRNCLGIIYTVFIEKCEPPLEKVIGKLLCIDIPSPGNDWKFSLGANDIQCIHLPASNTVPVTDKTVVHLFERLGIHNVITLLIAILTDHKILFHSKSYSILHESCHGLISLLYPFVYNHVYIPLLPSSLLEVLNTPTPFIIGVHSSVKNELDGLLDVIIVDLAGGFLRIPDKNNIPKLEESTYNDLVDHLCHIITPQLFFEDDAFPSSQLKPSPPSVLDKEIRAVFIRFFAKILQGYRTCLQVVRIHPKPFITFHKAMFLGKRDFKDNEFVIRLLRSMFFNIFIQERGLPYRVSDLFDELYATFHDTLRIEAREPETLMKHIKELAHILYMSEYSKPRESYNGRILRPTETTFNNSNRPLFPLLNGDIIQGILDSDRIFRELTSKKCSSYNPELKMIPFGPSMNIIRDNQSADRVFSKSDVVKNFVNMIFRERIQEVKENISNLLLALSNKSDCLYMVQEFSSYAKENKVVLSNQQFEIIVRLLNHALQQDCDYVVSNTSGLKGFGDVNGLAASILPLSMRFCRRLQTGVEQFAYTCLQDHPIWDDLSFWESTFYQTIEKEIISLYRHTINKSPYENYPRQTALDIAGEQMRLAPNLTDEELRVYAKSEESTIYSQAIEFIQRMISLKLPLDVANRDKPKCSKLNPSNENKYGEVSLSSAREYASEQEKDGQEFDGESGFEEGSNGKISSNLSEISSNLIKFTGKFVNKVCTETAVKDEHVKALHEFIPSTVAMQCESLDKIYKECKKMTQFNRPQLLNLSLVMDEKIIVSGIKAFVMVANCDKEEINKRMSLALSEDSDLTQSWSENLMLPSEGALFFTNYRVIFRGHPCDVLTLNSVNLNSIPLTSLTKGTIITPPTSFNLDVIIENFDQDMYRNCTQMVTIILDDDDLTVEAIEFFRKWLKKTKTPSSVIQLLTNTPWPSSSTEHMFNGHTMQKAKDKNSTIKYIAKKTLKKTVGGLPIKNIAKKSRHIIPRAGTKALPFVSLYLSKEDEPETETMLVGTIVPHLKDDYINKIENLRDDKSFKQSLQA